MGFLSIQALILNSAHTPQEPCTETHVGSILDGCARRVAVYENYKLRAEDLPLKGVYRGRLVVNFENINDISSTR